MKTSYLFITIALAVLIGGYLFTPSTPGVVEAQNVELNNGDTYELVLDEVKKEINGKEYTMLAYNGSIPGPVISVEQGAEVKITLLNKTDLPTLLHSHGLRVDNAFDGSQTTQKDIAPGESFTYTLKFSDVGAYWYHPHVSDYYAQELGAYGQFVVKPNEKNYWNPVNREVTMFLDDILIENGDIAADKKKATRTLMGSYGNIMLVNGETEYSLETDRGEVVRLYVTNAANSRPFNFAIEGAKMKLVGGDNGAYEREEWTDAVLISPSERAIVEVLFERAGKHTIVNKTPNRTYVLGKVTVRDTEVAESFEKEFGQLKTYQETVASIDSFRKYFSKEPDKFLSLSVQMNMGGMGGMGGGHGSHMMPDGTMMSNSGMQMGAAPVGGIEWEDDMMMNAMSDADSVKWLIVDDATKKTNMDIDWTFTRGEPVKIRIANKADSMHPMQHPIHFHGQRFLVVTRDGVQQTNLVWKDTALVKAGETIDIVLDTSNPGVWMAHCHILEHIESGMMMHYTVK